MSVGVYPRQQVTEPVTVQKFLGSGPFGDRHDTPVVTVCDLKAKRELVRGAGGEEVVSETTIRLAPETDPALDLEALFVPESKVTVRGRESVVINAAPILHRGKLVYLSVALT